MPEKYITPEQAAYLLGIGLRSLWRLSARGELPPPARFSRKLVRFNRRDLFRFMQLHTSPAPAATVDDAGPVFLIRDFRTGQEEFYRPNCDRPAFA
jgi:excisionase family DNA binding protein